MHNTLLSSPKVEMFILSSSQVPRSIQESNNLLKEGNINLASFIKTLTQPETIRVIPHAEVNANSRSQGESLQTLTTSLQIQVSCFQLPVGRDEYRTRT